MLEVLELDSLISIQNIPIRELFHEFEGFNLEVTFQILSGGFLLIEKASWELLSFFINHKIRKLNIL